MASPPFNIDDAVLAAAVLEAADATGLVRAIERERTGDAAILAARCHLDQRAVELVVNVLVAVGCVHRDHRGDRLISRPDRWLKPEQARTEVVALLEGRDEATPRRSSTTVEGIVRLAAQVAPSRRSAPRHPLDRPRSLRQDEATRRTPQ